MNREDVHEHEEMTPQRGGLRGSVATHVMVYSVDRMSRARVTRDEWETYQAAKKAKKKLPTLPWGNVDKDRHDPSATSKDVKQWGRRKGVVPNRPRRGKKQK